VNTSQRDRRPDVDLTDGAFYAADSRSAYAWMRANEPVFRDRNGLAAAATYQAVIDAERAPEMFSNAGGIRPDQDAPPMMIAMDDPTHLLRRKLVNAGFTRKRVKDREEAIGVLCDALIDAVCERGQCDFVRDIAAPLPMAVIGDILGVLPEEREMFLRWSDDMMNFLSSTTTEVDVRVTVQAFGAYAEYMMGMIAARKAEPIILLFESANFDETVFGDPENFRIDRYPNNHMAFGFGTHFCLGNQLARLELSMMNQRLLQRLPDMRLASEEPLPLRPANFVSGLETMPVVFTPSALMGTR
jgi:cytochrome P450